jgi:hypothetical protein
MKTRPSLVVTACLLVAVALAGSVASTSSSYNGVTANPTSNFTAAASFGCTPPTVNPVWMTGFEHGVNTAATGSGLLDIDWNSSATITSDTAVKRNGSYALKIVKTSTSFTGGRSRTVASSMVVFRIAFRLNALPSGDVRDFLGVWDSTGDDALNIGYNNASQKLSVGFSGGTQRLSASTLSAGTWYLLDVRANYGVNTHTADWQLNGTPQTQATKNSSAETPNEIWLGPDNSDAVITVWFDDFIISQTSGDYPIGDGKVLGLSPNAVNSINNPSSVLKTSGGVDPDSTSWQLVDDVPVSGGADHIRQMAINTGAYVALDMADTAETCINGVQGEVAYASQNTNNAVAKTSLYDGGTERVVYNGLMNPGATVSYKSAIVSPASGTWTMAKVNALTMRVGHMSAMTSNYVAWGALMVEYNVDL